MVARDTTEVSGSGLRRCLKSTTDSLRPNCTRGSSVACQLGQYLELNHFTLGTPQISLMASIRLWYVDIPFDSLWSLAEHRCTAGRFVCYDT